MISNRGGSLAWFLTLFAGRSCAGGQAAVPEHRSGLTPLKNVLQHLSDRPCWKTLPSQQVPQKIQVFSVVEPNTRRDDEAAVPLEGTVPTGGWYGSGFSLRRSGPNLTSKKPFTDKEMLEEGLPEYEAFLVHVCGCQEHHIITINLQRLCSFQQCLVQRFDARNLVGGTQQLPTVEYRC